MSATETVGPTGQGTATASAYQFPVDSYDNESGHWLVLTEYKYFRVSSTNQGQGNATGNTFKLPVPIGLATGYDADWESVDLGIFGTSVLNGLEGVGELKNLASSKLASIFGGGQSTDAVHGQADFSKSSASQKQSLWSDLINGAQSVGTGLVGGLVDQGMSTESATKLGLYGGVARNPFVAMAYKGPSLRSFNLRWEFLPRTYEESEALLKLITALKYGMHPSYTSLAGVYQNALFEYPNLYQPKFTNDSFLFSFGFCVIKSVEVNYHPKGNVYHSKDGNKVPAMIELAVNLQEIEVITKETVMPSSGVGK